MTKIKFFTILFLIIACSVTIFCKEEENDKVIKIEPASESGVNEEKNQTEQGSDNTQEKKRNKKTVARYLMNSKAIVCALKLS